MKKIIILILSLVCVVVCIIYGAMLYDTNSVVDDFKNCIRGDNIIKEISDTILYKTYYFYDDFKDMVYTDIEVRRNFVFHNFRQGIMWINYTYYAFNSEGINIKGSHNVNSKWYIKKENGRWIVYDIEEAP